MCQTPLTYDELAERYAFLVADRARLERELHYCTLALAATKTPAPPLAEPVKPSRLPPRRTPPEDVGTTTTTTPQRGEEPKKVRVTLRGANTKAKKSRELEGLAEHEPSATYLNLFMGFRRELHALAEHDASHRGVFASPKSLKRIPTFITPKTCHKKRARDDVDRHAARRAVLPCYGDPSGVRERGDVLVVGEEEEGGARDAAFSALVLAEERLADACVA